MCVPGALEETDGHNDAEFAGELRHRRDQSVAFKRRGQPEMVGRLVLAEIRRFKQFLDEHDIRALPGCLADQFLRFRDIGGPIPRARKLRGGDRHRSHAGSCWVMQWMPPPPSTISSASICRISRPGKQSASTLRADSSLRSSNEGMTMPPL